MKKIIKSLLNLSIVVTLSACSSSLKETKNTSKSEQSSSKSTYIIARSKDPSPLMEYFSENYEEIEKAINSRSNQAAQKIISLWEYCEKLLEDAPKKTTYYQDKTFEPISLSEAIGSRCYIWIPDYREVALGVVQPNGEISGNGVVFDYTYSSSNEPRTHFNYGSFENGMLNGEGVSFRVDLDKNNKFQNDRLMVGNFINNRPDGIIPTTFSLGTSDERNTKLEANNGDVKVYKTLKDGYSVVGYYEEDSSNGYVIPDANDLYLTYYDRITNKTY